MALSYCHLLSPFNIPNNFLLLYFTRVDTIPDDNDKKMQNGQHIEIKQYEIKALLDEDTSVHYYNMSHHQRGCFIIFSQEVIIIIASFIFFIKQ